MNALTLAALEPGDVLLYSGRGPMSLVIRLVTASRYTHVEMFDGLDAAGAPRAWASRDGIGVGRYPFRRDGLALALRIAPGIPFDLDGARDFWRQADGEPYDWPGLAVSRFPSLQGRSGDERAQFCSEAMTRAVRHGVARATGIVPARGFAQLLADAGRDPFNGSPAEAIHPGAFAWCPFFRAFEVIS